MTGHDDRFNAYVVGLLNDIHIADESYHAIFFVSDHCSEINEARLGHFFGRLQNSYFIDATLLATGRLFDTSKDVVSIPNMIRSSAQFRLTNKDGFAAELEKLGVSSAAVRMIRDEGLSRRAAKELQKFAPTKDKHPELTIVIGRRHEQVAHRGIPRRFDPPAFSDVKICSQIAKDWLACFALGINNYRMRDGTGQFRFSSSARTTARHMQRILERLTHSKGASGDRM